MARAEWALWLLLLSCKTNILEIEHMMRQTTRIFVLSGPSLFANGLQVLLGEEAGLEIVGRETDPRQAVSRIRGSHPDVIVVADGEGVTELEAELLRLVREGFPMGIVEVHLGTNTVCVYCGEQRAILEVGDLADTIHRICAALHTEA